MKSTINMDTKIRNTHAFTELSVADILDIRSALLYAKEQSEVFINWVSDTSMDTDAEYDKKVSDLISTLDNIENTLNQAVVDNIYRPAAV